jgi:glycosyltransferase involved in cell wall biosynthesis
VTVAARSDRRSATPPLVSVIVPVRDMDDEVRALLGALDRQTVPREQFEIVVAGDGSVSASLAALSTGDDHVRVLAGPRLNSYAARNRAVAAAKGSVIASCDADCRPMPEWLERGVTALQAADVVGGAILFVPPARQTIWALLDMTTFLDQKRAVRSGYAVTANMFFRRELFDRMGGFDDSQPNQGDYDFVSRCVRAGATLVFAPDAVVLHPARETAERFLGKLWTVNRRYAERESSAGRKPEGLKLRNWVPVVQTLRSRTRLGRPLGLDRERLAESGVAARAVDRVRALPFIYLLVPYVAGIAQLHGWRVGRRHRTQPARPAQERTAISG